MYMTSFGFVIEASPAVAQGWRKWALRALFFLLPVCIASFFSPSYVTNQSYHLSDYWLSSFAYLGRKSTAAIISTAIAAVYQGWA